jgi:hypothetical protein
MPNSVADEYRQKLSPELRAVCEMLDRELVRELPPSMSDETDWERRGRLNGLRRAISLIERKG